MICFEQQAVRESAAEADWQATFLKMLPTIQRKLRRAFRCLDAEAREEAVQEGIANCLTAFVRLHKQGRATEAFAGSLADFAIRRVIEGRQVGCSANVRDPLSRYAQLSKGIRVQSLDPERSASWVNALVDDRRAAIPDQVAARIDVSSWLRSLTPRKRAVARDFGFGYSTGEMARRFNVSSGRISQLRNELFDSWSRFYEDDAGSRSGSYIATRSPAKL